MSCKKIIWTWYHKLWVEVSISVYGYINIIFISLFCFVLFLYATKKLVGPYGITLKKKLYCISLEMNEKRIDPKKVIIIIII